MKRQVSIEEIWDGRFYGPGDMVKIGCGECSGCSDCCKGMGKTIILDPLDIYRLTEGLHTDFQQLIGSHLELNVVDGVILPNLLEAGAEEVCTFLNKEGRCSIHSIASSPWDATKKVAASGIFSRPASARKSQKPK